MNCYNANFEVEKLDILKALQQLTKAVEPKKVRWLSELSAIKQKLKPLSFYICNRSC